MARSTRVNELLKREISLVLHTRYQDETVGVTVVAVDTTPNLRKAIVLYSVIGDERALNKARHFFARHHADIRERVGRTVTLKYLPHLHFQPNDGLAEGARLNSLLDELGLEGEGTMTPEEAARILDQ